MLACACVLYIFVDINDINSEIDIQDMIENSSNTMNSEPEVDLICLGGQIQAQQQSKSDLISSSSLSSGVLMGKLEPNLTTDSTSPVNLVDLEVLVVGDGQPTVDHPDPNNNIVTASGSSSESVSSSSMSSPFETNTNLIFESTELMVENVVESKEMVDEMHARFDLI